MKSVRVQSEDFDPGAELTLLEVIGAGAVASFTGLVRGDDGVDRLVLEHYPGMTERSLEDLVEAAWVRWPLSGVTVIHRIGDLALGERIVFVGTASAHRAAALEACAFLIDQLKTSAPFWKQEWVSGKSRWGDARAGDADASARWLKD